MSSQCHNRSNRARRLARHVICRFKYSNSKQTGHHWSSWWFLGGQSISIYGLDGFRQGLNFYCNVIGDSRKRLEGRHEIHGVGKDQMGRDKSNRLEERWVVMNCETQSVGTGKGRDEGKKQTCVSYGVRWWSSWRVRQSTQNGWESRVGNRGRRVGNVFRWEAGLEAFEVTKRGVGDGMCSWNHARDVWRSQGKKILQEMQMERSTLWRSLRKAKIQGVRR